MPPNSYPLLFKERVVKYYNSCKSASVKDVLHIFNISNGSLFNWLNLSSKQMLADKMKYTKQSKATPAIKCYIRVYILKKINFNYKLLLRYIKRKFNTTLSKSTLYNVIHKLNISRKKIKTVPVIKNKVKHDKDVRTLKAKVKYIHQDKIISIDESHFDNKICSLYGWSVKGSSIRRRQYLRCTKRYTLICAVSNKKVVHHCVINGSANSEIFRKFVMELNGKIPNNSYLLLDNARIHHAKIVKEYINETSHTLLYNAPYCPEYNPIEKVFSKIKSYIRTKSNNGDPVNLKYNIVKSLKSVRMKDLRNFYKSSLEF